jgi:hypothetical protein
MNQRTLISALLDMTTGVMAGTPGPAAGQRAALFACPAIRCG